MFETKKSLIRLIKEYAYRDHPHPFGCWIAALSLSPPLIPNLIRGKIGIGMVNFKYLNLGHPHPAVAAGLAAGCHPHPPLLSAAAKSSPPPKRSPLSSAIWTGTSTTSGTAFTSVTWSWSSAGLGRACPIARTVAKISYADKEESKP